MECVQFHKYLGTITDSKLNYEANCEAVSKKGNHFVLSEKTVLFPHCPNNYSVIPLLNRSFSLSLVSQFGNLSLKNRNSLNQTVKWSGRLISESQLSPESLYTRQLQRITSSIFKWRLPPFAP